MSQIDAWYTRKAAPAANASQTIAMISSDVASVGITENVAPQGAGAGSSVGAGRSAGPGSLGGDGAAGAGSRGDAGAGSGIGSVSGTGIVAGSTSMILRGSPMSIASPFVFAPRGYDAGAAPETHAYTPPRDGLRTMDVYVERGSKRVFASAIAWPGWTRAARTEEAALDGLLAYGPRYAKAVARSRLGFAAPGTVDDLDVVARVTGNATTDFGAPDRPAPGDDAPIDPAELRRLTAILRASWRALDTASEAASGEPLATGPRGGGRSLDAIVDHVTDAERGYVQRLAWKATADADADGVRAAVIEALTNAVEHGIEPVGPRGGKRWLPRYFVRRTTWHALDHAWEIEDRSA
jgi:hypothetical protein